MLTFQRKSHIPYGPPTSVTWRQLLRKQTGTCTSPALTATTFWSARLRLRAFSRHHPRLANVNCAWRWIRCEINRAIYGVNTVLWGCRFVCVSVWCVCGVCGVWCVCVVCVWCVFVCVCVWCVCVCVCVVCVCAWCVCVCDVCVCQWDPSRHFLPFGPHHVAILVIAKPLHAIFQYGHRHDGLRSSAFD